MTKLALAVAATLAYLALLVIAYVVHVRFFTVDVVFYSALFDVAIAVGVGTLALWTLRWFDALSVLEKLQLSAIWLLTGYALAISVPTVIDRSLSFYLLEKLAQRGGGIRQDAFETIIIDEFLDEHRLVDARLTEQLESGTIAIHDGCVSLTAKGRRIAAFSRGFRAHFLPRQRLLMGTYSDELTDPFRRSVAQAPYRCGQE